MTEHHFGGEWTKLKLDKLEKYLKAYSMIFNKNQNAKYYTTWYVDAFAGTGYCHTKKGDDEPDLFKEIEEKTAQDYLNGSAMRALGIEPGFDRYLFIEKSAEHVAELEKLRETFPRRSESIIIKKGGANAELKDWCQKTDWDKNRAVVFLDPYGMQVEWDTLKRLAETRAIDLWLLFPVGQAVTRLLTNNRTPPPAWEKRLTIFFGDGGWKNRFYRRSMDQGLFDLEELYVEKRAEFKEIGDYMVERLKTIFADVHPKPYPLFNSQNVPLFLLLFAVGNPKPSIVRAALRIADHLVKDKAKG